MAPARAKKQATDQPASSARRHDATQDTKVPIHSPSTPQQRGAVTKRKMGITAYQKQALIDNLQIETTERARRLRAQYQLQAQGLRSRIEIRINRIPMSLRKLKMGDLLLKHLDQEQNKQSTKPPPVPAKDTPRGSPQRTVPQPQPAARGYKRMSGEIAGDKENDFGNIDGPKKRARVAQAAETRQVRPNQILSPTSSNSRIVNRDRPASPTKSQIARPGSPLKSAGASRSAAATSVLSSMVEKAKATRTRGTRKVTTTSDTSSASNATTTAAKPKRPAATTMSRVPASRPATRAGRRVSGTSETSDASAGTVVRKASRTKTAPSNTRSTVMSTIRKGVASAGSKRATAKASAAPASTAASGRVLRKRT